MCIEKSVAHDQDKKIEPEPEMTAIKTDKNLQLL